MELGLAGSTVLIGPASRFANVGAIHEGWWYQRGCPSHEFRCNFRIGPTGSTAVMHPELTTMPDPPAESWQAAIDISH